MVRIRRLPNGVRVITEQVEGVRSCGIGVWIETGSRHESDDECGMAHFAEHMLFKGTREHDFEQLAERMNYLGGNINAFTSQEHICLHARTVDRKAHEALDLLGEMAGESTFPVGEIRRERQVVLEELSSVCDQPEEFSVDKFLSNLWPGDPLGRPVIGTRRTIRGFNRRSLQAFWSRACTPDRVIVALAGAFDVKACDRVITRRFASWPADGATAEGPCGHARPARKSYLKRHVEQVYLCLGTEGPDRVSPDRFAFGLMNMILGGGMSSRLCLEIRERRGLAYSIGSFVQSFSDRGFFAVSGGTNHGTMNEVLRITLDEMGRIAHQDVPRHELELAREQVLDSLLMGLENTGTRMGRLAESLMTFGRAVPVDETMREVRKVTVEDIRRVAREYLWARPLAIAAVGPAEGRAPSLRAWRVPEGVTH